MNRTHRVSLHTVPQARLNCVHAPYKIVVLCLEVLLAVIRLLELLSQSLNLVVMTRLSTLRSLPLMLALYAFQAFPQLGDLLSQSVPFLRYRV